LVVDDPRSSLVSGETTVTEDFPRFESDTHSSLLSSATSTLDPIDDLLVSDDLGVDALGPETLTTDVLEGDDLGQDPLIVEGADVDVIVADESGLTGTTASNVTSIGWIAPTDADLLLEEEEADPVIALAFADRPSTDGEAIPETMARPEDTEGLEDHVRMYLREIGLVPLLSWDGEKRLARRMEEGIYLERLAREVQQPDSEATALEVMAELERRFEAHFNLLGHWFPTLETTVSGFRTAMTTLGDTAEISVDRCQELASRSELLA
jgi:Sigma-70 factor, region 1.2